MIQRITEQSNTVSFRQNQITRFSELDKLAVLPNLKHLVLMGNPIANEEIYRLESLFRVPQTTRLDKDAILDEDREEVEAYKNNRVDPTAQESNNSSEVRI